MKNGGKKSLRYENTNVNGNCWEWYVYFVIAVFFPLYFPLSFLYLCRYGFFVFVFARFICAWSHSLPYRILPVQIMICKGTREYEIRHYAIVVVVVFFPYFSLSSSFQVKHRACERAHTNKYTLVYSSLGTKQNVFWNNLFFALFVASSLWHSVVYFNCVLLRLLRACVRVSVLLLSIWIFILDFFYRSAICAFIYLLHGWLFFIAIISRLSILKAFRPFGIPMARAGSSSPSLAASVTIAVDVVVVVVAVSHCCHSLMCFFFHIHLAFPLIRSRPMRSRTRTKLRLHCV